MAPYPTSRSPDGETNAGGVGAGEEGSSSEQDQDSMPKLRISGEALRKLVSQVRFDIDSMNTSRKYMHCRSSLRSTVATGTAALAPDLRHLFQQRDAQMTCMCRAPAARRGLE